MNIDLRFPWTNRQLSQLREHYPDAERDDLERMLDPHPWTSICEKARSLGLKRRNRNWRQICAAHKPVFDFGSSSFK